MRKSFVSVMVICLGTLGIVCGGPSVLGHTLDFGPEEIVQAAGSDLRVLGYSVPSYVDFNNDGRKDLVVGEGGAGSLGKVRVYLNEGTAAAPQFSGFSYVQSEGGDLVVPAIGCLGAFPRVAYFDADRRKDLVVGQADGTVKVFVNVGSDDQPTFDGGTLLEAGVAGGKTPIDVGHRATLDLTDFDNDGARDLVMGAYDGKIHLYLNQGTDVAPDFAGETILPDLAGDLLVPSGRSSPVLSDLDGDGKKDLLTGNSSGQILLYGNQGTDPAPSFSTFGRVTSAGVAIDLAGDPRSRPFVTDFTGDGLADLLVGAVDGKVHLYQGVPEPASVWLLAMGAVGVLTWVLVRRRRGR